MSSGTQPAATPPKGNARHKSWPTNAERAEALYRRAGEVEWQGYYANADTLRTRADKLMENPEYREPDF